MKIIKQIPAFIYGIIFGMTNVIPGVSTGTMMVVFGCYDIVCGALALDFKHIKKHLTFLVLFGIGAMVGLGGAIFAVSEFLERFPVPTYLFFIGLIIGSLPIIKKNLKEGGKIKKSHIIFAVIAFAVVVGLYSLQVAEIAEETIQLTPAFGARLFFGGFTAAAALIIPGISGAFILLLFGIYPVITGAAKTFMGGEVIINDLLILVIAGVGIITGVVFGARLIKWLLSRFYTAVYCVIMGLMVGSIITLFPAGLGLNLPWIIGMLMFFAGMVIPYIAGKNKTDRI
jgi:putative membrane protein